MPITFFANADQWAKLPPASRQECLNLDHGTFTCPHHPEPFPPAFADDIHDRLSNEDTA